MNRLGAQGVAPRWLWKDGRQEGGAQVAVQAGHPGGGAQVDFLEFCWF